MDNTQDESGFDYKSRDWEKSMSNPVCVACLNESRAHQIPGDYEHICGKKSTNDNTQLPADVENEIWEKAKVYARMHGRKEVGYYSLNWQAGATVYATKQHQAEQEIKAAYAQATMIANKSAEWEGKVYEAWEENKKMRALLEKFISRHESDTLSWEFINEIKSFLNGTK